MPGCLRSIENQESPLVYLKTSHIFQCQMWIRIVPVVHEIINHNICLRKHLVQFFGFTDEETEGQKN